MSNPTEWYKIDQAARITYNQFVKETMQAMPGAVEPATWEILPSSYKAAWIRIFRAGYTMFEEGIVINFPEAEHE